MLDTLSSNEAPNLTVVPARVEELELPIKFQLIIMSSHIINLVNPSQRQSLYASTVKHMDSANGVLALEVNRPDWYRKAQSLSTVEFELNACNTTRLTASGPQRKAIIVFM